MAINPAVLLRLHSLKKGFEGRHPKIVEFFEKELMKEFQEGTVFELSVTRPGEKTIATNMKVTAEDLELLQELKKLQ